MLPPSTLISLLVIIAARRTFAQLKPTTPGPNETYTAGSSCNISWVPDTSGSWTNVTIDLMSGSNNNMSLVKNVASALDGTDESLTPYSWTCPEVDPYSAIYFYQFTNGDDISTRTWTTRFTIAPTSKKTVPPENSQQPNGDNIPWGTGHLKEVESISISSADGETNSYSAQTTLGVSPASPSATGRGKKKPHGHKGDSDSDDRSGSSSEDGETEENRNDDGARDPASRTRHANVAGAKSSAARATAIAHTHASSSSPNGANAEESDGHDSDGSDEKSGSGESNQAESPMHSTNTTYKNSGAADAADSANGLDCRRGYSTDRRNGAGAQLVETGFAYSITTSIFSALVLACF